MILTAIYSIFCIGEVWTPVDLFKIDIPEHLKEQQLVKAIKQATSFLEKQGLSIVKLW
jgi:transposase